MTQINPINFSLSDDRIKELTKKIKEYDNIILFHHINPDGDCIATSFGLANALRQIFPKKNIKVAADKADFDLSFPFYYPFMDWDNTVTKWNGEKFLAIIGDVSVVARIRHYDEFMPNADYVVCFDHHENEPDFKIDFFWTEKKYVAATLMAIEISQFPDFAVKLEEPAALLFYFGIVTDSQFFRACGAAQRPYYYSGFLMSSLNDKVITDIYWKLGLRTPNFVDFTAWVYTNYDQVKDVASFQVPAKVWQEFNFKSGLQVKSPNLLGGIKGINVWMEFVEVVEENSVFAEFRSSTIDCSVLATKFGGGGHPHSAGARLKDFSQVSDIVAEAVKMSEESNSNQ